METVKESVQILMDLPVSVTEEIKVEEEKIVKNEEFEEYIKKSDESVSDLDLNKSDFEDLKTTYSTYLPLQ